MSVEQDKDIHSTTAREVGDMYSFASQSIGALSDSKVDTATFLEDNDLKELMKVFTELRDTVQKLLKGRVDGIHSVFRDSLIAKGKLDTDEEHQKLERIFFDLKGLISSIKLMQSRIDSFYVSLQNGQQTLKSRASEIRGLKGNIDVQTQATQKFENELELLKESHQASREGVIQLVKVHLPRPEWRNIVGQLDDPKNWINALNTYVENLLREFGEVNQSLAEEREMTQSLTKGERRAGEKFIDANFRLSWILKAIAELKGNIGSFFETDTFPVIDPKKTATELKDDEVKHFLQRIKDTFARVQEDSKKREDDLSDQLKALQLEFELQDIDNKLLVKDVNSALSEKSLFERKLQDADKAVQVAKDHLLRQNAKLLKMDFKEAKLKRKLVKQSLRFKIRVEDLKKSEEQILGLKSQVTKLQRKVLVVKFGATLEKRMHFLETQELEKKELEFTALDLREIQNLEDEVWTANTTITKLRAEMGALGSGSAEWLALAENLYEEYGSCLDDDYERTPETDEEWLAFMKAVIDYLGEKESNAVNLTYQNAFLKLEYQTLVDVNLDLKIDLQRITSLVETDDMNKEDLDEVKEIADVVDRKIQKLKLRISHLLEKVRHESGERDSLIISQKNSQKLVDGLMEELNDVVYQLFADGDKSIPEAVCKLQESLLDKTKELAELKSKIEVLEKGREGYLDKLNSLISDNVEAGMIEQPPVEKFETVSGAISHIKSSLETNLKEKNEVLSKSEIAELVTPFVSAELSAIQLESDVPQTAADWFKLLIPKLNELENLRPLYHQLIETFKIFYEGLTGKSFDILADGYADADVVYKAASEAAQIALEQKNTMAELTKQSEELQSKCTQLTTWMNEEAPVVKHASDLHTYCRNYLTELLGDEIKNMTTGEFLDKLTAELRALHQSLNENKLSRSDIDGVVQEGRRGHKSITGRIQLVIDDKQESLNNVIELEGKNRELEKELKEVRRKLKNTVGKEAELAAENVQLRTKIDQQNAEFQNVLHLDHVRKWMKDLFPKESMQVAQELNSNGLDVMALFKAPAGLIQIFQLVLSSVSKQMIHFRKQEKLLPVAAESAEDFVEKLFFEHFPGYVKEAQQQRSEGKMLEYFKYVLGESLTSNGDVVQHFRQVFEARIAPQLERNKSYSHLDLSKIYIALIDEIRKDLEGLNKYVADASSKSVGEGVMLVDDFSKEQQKMKNLESQLKNMEDFILSDPKNRISRVEDYDVAFHELIYALAVSEIALALVADEFDQNKNFESGLKEQKRAINAMEREYREKYEKLSLFLRFFKEGAEKKGINIGNAIAAFENNYEKFKKADSARGKKKTLSGKFFSMFLPTKTPEELSDLASAKLPGSSATDNALHRNNLRKSLKRYGEKGGVVDDGFSQMLLNVKDTMKFYDRFVDFMTSKFLHVRGIIQGQVTTKTNQLQEAVESHLGEDIPSDQLSDESPVIDKLRPGKRDSVIISRERLQEYFDESEADSRPDSSSLPDSIKVPEQSNEDPLASFFSRAPITDEGDVSTTSNGKIAESPPAVPPPVPPSKSKVSMDSMGSLTEWDKKYNELAKKNPSGSKKRKTAKKKPPPSSNQDQLPPLDTSTKDGDISDAWKGIPGTE